METAGAAWAGLQALLAHWSGGEVDWKLVLLAGATPLFLLAFLAESWVLRDGPPRREVWTNLGLGAAYQAAEGLAWWALTAPLFAWVWQHRLFDLPVNGWTLGPIFLLVEACYYAFHRSSHRVRWFWAAHVPHHSGQEMDFSTAARQSVLNAVVGSFVFYLPPVWLGVPPAVVMALLALDLVYQFFVHTTVVGRLPAWFEWVFNTPSHHRAHHGRNPQYRDRNYGGVLIVFDRLFGTWVPEEEAVDYGITRQPRSRHPLVLNLHEFVDLWRDVAAPGPWRARLKHLWGPPEWERPGHAPVHTWAVDRRD